MAFSELVFALIRWIAIVGVVAALAMGLDKLLAKLGTRTISERTGQPVEPFRERRNCAEIVAEFGKSVGFVAALGLIDQLKRSHVGRSLASRLPLRLNRG